MIIVGYDLFERWNQSANGRDQLCGGTKSDLLN